MTVGGDIQHAGWHHLDRNFTLFEAEDEVAWIIFVVVFLALIIFDNAIIFSRPRRMTFSSAVFYTLFWGSTAFAFCFWVGYWQGVHSSYMWFSGYTLQWMMSFDNLFVFHLIFKVYQTPDRLKHRPLFLGILGQAIFTFSLLTVGEFLFHKLFFLHMIFGLFFIYIGVTSITGDDDDDDPTQNPMIQWLQAKLPFVSVYDTQGHFFVRLPVDEKGNAKIPDNAYVSMDSRLETDPLNSPGTRFREEALETQKVTSEAAPDNYFMIDLARIDLQGHKTQLKATMLFLVVCTMEISDVIFSVDTIVAVSVQVGDLFLAFTCVAFALLTLRATFFIVEVLVQMFSLMNYGIAAILVYIGIKLLIDRFYVPPHLFDLLVLVGCFTASIVASAIYDSMVDKDADDEKDAEEKGSAEKLLCK